MSCVRSWLKSSMVEYVPIFDHFIKCKKKTKTEQTSGGLCYFKEFLKNVVVVVFEAV